MLQLTSSKIIQKEWLPLFANQELNINIMRIIFLFESQNPSIVSWFAMRNRSSLHRSCVTVWSGDGNMNSIGLYLTYAGCMEPIIQASALYWSTYRQRPISTSRTPLTVLGLKIHNTTCKIITVLPNSRICCQFFCYITSKGTESFNLGFTD